MIINLMEESILLYEVLVCYLMEHLCLYNNALLQGLHYSVVLANGINRGFDQYKLHLNRPKATKLQRDHFCPHKRKAGVLVRSALTDSFVLFQYVTETLHFLTTKRFINHKSFEKPSCLPCSCFSFSVVLLIF